MDMKMEESIKNEGEELDCNKEEDTVKSEHQGVVEASSQTHEEDNDRTDSIFVKEICRDEDDREVPVCRLCAEDITDKSYSIFEQSDVSFYEKINFSLPIHVVLGDELPNCICEPCKNTLEDVYNFANKVSVANEVLKARYCKSKEVAEKDNVIEEEEESPKSKEKKSLSVANIKAHYVCHLCGKKFRYEHLLKAHSEDHKELKSSIVPVCSYCGETFVTEESAAAHINSKHDLLGRCTRIEHNLVDMAYVCEFCEKIFVNSNKLMYHKKSEHKFKMYACGICSVKFTTYTRRQEHKETHCEYKEARKTNELPLMKHYLCDLCGKSYLQYEYLAAHHKLKHKTATKSYKCQKCKEVFPSGTAISYHYKIKHHVNYFLCPEKGCYNQFTTEGALKKHLNEVHKAPVVCYKCGKIFTDKPALRQHIQNNHATLVNVCEVCGLTFKTLKAFENHKNEHLNGQLDKNFVCVICKKVYAYRFELQKHMRDSHSGNFRLLVDMDEDSMDQDVAKSLMALRSESVRSGTKRTHQEVFLNFANKYTTNPNCPIEFGLIGKDGNPVYFPNAMQNKRKGEVYSYAEVQASENSNDQVQYCYVNMEGNRKVLLLDNA